MQAGADLIVRRLWRAAALRRAPVWLAAVLPWCLLLSLPGLLACAALAAADLLYLHARILRDWARWLDSSLPELEDSSALLAQASSPIGRLQRARLLARALGDEQLRQVARERVAPGFQWLAASVTAAVAVWAWPTPAASPKPLPASVAAAAVNSALVVRIAPPGYTGVAAIESAPRDLAAPEGSEVQWCVKDGGDQTIELSDGQRLVAGRSCARWSATESVFWRWRGVRYNLRVTPDQPPQITVSKPSEMVQVLAKDAHSAALAVSVRDDYLVKRATLHLTLARGSGENIRFSDREVPLPASNDPRRRDWSKTWTLSELGMEPGDELYFFVRASDNAAREHVAQSPTYTLRLPGPDSVDEESSALPTLVKPENLRSQRQVIIDTEQLLADMKATKMGAAALRTRSESIASDQAQLRLRYGQFLGEESSLFGDEHAEHEGKHDLVAEFGHMHDQAENATLFDESTKKVLRRALTAMWDAEKSLRAITPQSALAPENKALEAIKQLQQADRIYLHKTAFVPPAIKEEIRMTGDVAGAKGYKREQGAPDQAIPAPVRALLHALGSDAPLPALWSRDAQDWIRTRIGSDEQRLAAQRAVQDVADGCVACRPVLRAWLRGAITEAPVLLQAKPSVETPFTQAFRTGVKP